MNVGGGRPSENGPGRRRVVLYARVSTEEQARSGFSLAQQLEALREYAERAGYEVVEEVSDPGYSGASLARPGIDRVRRLVAAGAASVVLAQDRDRISREPAYGYLLRREFEERGGRLVALNDSGDGSPEGQLMEEMLDLFSKYDRAKMVERSRRGKLRRAREGKIVPGNRAPFGFRYNAGRTNFVLEPGEMQTVGRILRAIAVEGRTIHGVKRALEADGVPSPGGTPYWTQTFIRSVIFNDVYRPHDYADISHLLSPEAAAGLDHAGEYGVWWFNRERHTFAQVAEDGPRGRRYRRRAHKVENPLSERIAVPVPSSRIPRKWVDAAREVVKSNVRTTRLDDRVWEVSHGILRCDCCGWSMTAKSIFSASTNKSNYYYRCSRDTHYPGQCPNRRVHRADVVEPRVATVVSRLLRSAGWLLIGVEEALARERDQGAFHVERELRAWEEELAGMDYRRSRLQDMAAEGYITFEELAGKLRGVEMARESVARESARMGIASLKRRKQDRAAAPENETDALHRWVKRKARPSIERLDPGQRRRLYSLLRLTVLIEPDGALEVRVPDLGRILRRSLPAVRKRPASGRRQKRD